MNDEDRTRKSIAHYLARTSGLLPVSESATITKNEMKIITYMIIFISIGGIVAVFLRDFTK